METTAATDGSVTDASPSLHAVGRMNTDQGEAWGLTKAAMNAVNANARHSATS